MGSVLRGPSCVVQTDAREMNRVKVQGPVQGEDGLTLGINILVGGMGFSGEMS